MTEQSREEIEDIVCRWAENQKYKISERIWKCQLQQERDITRGICPVRFSPGRENTADDIKQVLDDILLKATANSSDCTRYIYFPMGYINYIFSVKGQRADIKSDEDFESYNGHRTISLQWSLGRFLSTWNSPQCTLGQRTENELISGAIHWDSDTDKTELVQMCVNPTKNRYKTNFFYQAIRLSTYLQRQHRIITDEPIETTTRRILCLVSRFHHVARHPSQLYNMDTREEYTDEFEDFNL